MSPEPKHSHNGGVLRAFSPLAVVAERLAFGLLLAAVVWAPWPLGSNRPWAVGLLGGTLALGLALACVTPGLLSRLQTSQARDLIWAPVLALAAFSALLVAQMLPGLAGSRTTLSIDVFGTQRYLFTTLTYTCAWVLILLTVHTARRALVLLSALAAAGVLQALAAVVLSATRWKYEFLFASFDQGGRATGTFVNPDHLAGYMELTLSAGLGWLFSQFANRVPNGGKGWKAGLSAFLTFVLSPKMLLRLMLVMMVIALVMTHSRMGNGAFFFALLLTGALVAWRSKKLRKPAIWVVASMALVDALIIGQWVGVDRVLERIQQTAKGSFSGGAATTASVNSASSGLGTMSLAPAQIDEQTLAERMEVPKMSLALVAARPWFGHGGGSYEIAFPAYKTSVDNGLDLYWDRAHNDFVQIACDTGLVGLFIWLIPGLLTFWKASRLLNDRLSALHRGIGFAALMALFCMGLHSMVDFNLHIPANALTLTVMLALVWALPASSDGFRRKNRRSRNAKTPAHDD